MINIRHNQYLSRLNTVFSKTILVNPNDLDSYLEGVDPSKVMTGADAIVYKDRKELVRLVYGSYLEMGKEILTVGQVSKLYFSLLYKGERHDEEYLDLVRLIKTPHYKTEYKGTAFVVDLREAFWSLTKRHGLCYFGSEGFVKGTPFTDKDIDVLVPCKNTTKLELWNALKRSRSGGITAVSGRQSPYSQRPAIAFELQEIAVFAVKEFGCVRVRTDSYAFKNKETALSFMEVIEGAGLMTTIKNEEIDETKSSSNLLMGMFS